MKQFSRFIVVALILAASASVLLSACSRGYGCPYKTQVVVKK